MNRNYVRPVSSLQKLIITSTVVGAVLISNYVEAATPKAQPRTLNLAFLGALSQPLDPAVYYAGQGLLITMNIYQQLVQYKPNSPIPTIEPDLASSWKIAKSGLKYTFYLRKGVTFHDGSPFSCPAVSASFANIAAVNGGPAYMVKEVQSVKCPSPYKAVVYLKKPVNAFMNFLASAYGPRMQSPKSLKDHQGHDDDQKWLSTHDDGTGPYYLASAKPGVAYVLKSYKNYWGHHPYYNTINIRVIPSITTQLLELKGGDLDAILHGIPAVELKNISDDRSLAVYNVASLQMAMLYVNPGVPPFNSIVLRQAFMHAINKSELVDYAFPGEATVTNRIYPNEMLPHYKVPEISGYDPKIFKNDIKKMPDSDKNITIGYQSNVPSAELAANVLQSQLGPLGLHISVVGYPGSEVFNWPVKDAGAPQLFMYANLWPDDASPYSWANIIFNPGGGLNFFQCSVTAATKLLEKGNSTVSDEDADKLFAAAGDLYGKSGCWNSFASRKGIMVLSSKLSGLVYNVGAPQSLYLQYLHPKTK